MSEETARLRQIALAAAAQRGKALAAWNEAKEELKKQSKVFYAGCEEPLTLEEKAEVATYELYRAACRESERVNEIYYNALHNEEVV